MCAGRQGASACLLVWHMDMVAPQCRNTSMQEGSESLYQNLYVTVPAYSTGLPPIAAFTYTPCNK